MTVHGALAWVGEHVGLEVADIVSVVVTDGDEVLVNDPDCVGVAVAVAVADPVCVPVGAPVTLEVAVLDLVTVDDSDGVRLIVELTLTLSVGWMTPTIWSVVGGVST